MEESLCLLTNFYLWQFIWLRNDSTAEFAKLRMNIPWLQLGCFWPWLVSWLGRRPAGKLFSDSLSRLAPASDCLDVSGRMLLLRLVRLANEV